MLKRSLISSDTTVVYATLYRIKQSISSQITPSQLSGWALLLIKTNTNGSPDVQLLLADLFIELHHWLPDKKLPDWRSWNTITCVSVAWLKVELLLYPKMISDLKCNEISLQTLNSIESDKLLYPEETIQKLSLTTSELFQLRALELTRQCVELATISPKTGTENVLSLCELIGIRSSFLW